MEGLGVLLPAFTVRSVPGLERGRRPLRGFVGVAVVAGFGRAEPCRQVGPRDAEAVIVAPGDEHMGALPHLAGRAGEAPICGITAVGSWRSARFLGVAT